MWCLLLKDEVYLVEVALGANIRGLIAIESRVAVQAGKQPQSTGGRGLLHRDQHGARVGHDAIVLPAVQAHRIVVHLAVVQQVLLLVARNTRPTVLANALSRIGAAVAVKRLSTSTST
jgi:hypothetical protein